MLATDILQHLQDVPYGDDFAHRLNGAQKFVLDPQACAMAAGVHLSKPSSIISALSFAKLPFEPTWLEFANADIRRAMAELGSPNMKTPDAVTTIERAGFLLSTSADGKKLEIDYVHRDRTKDAQTLTDIAPVKARFSLLGQDEEVNLPDIARSMRTAAEAPAAEGKVKKHLDLLSSDPLQAAADADLRSRLSFSPHPELAKVREMLVSRMGEGRVTLIEQGQESELHRLFMLVALPALILLNCRNAVEMERVEAPAKLNKQRTKKGKVAIPEHQIVKMHLSPARRRIYESMGGRAAALGGAVIGHFKVRKTGVYWWSPHWRGARADKTRDRTIILTR